MDVTSNAQAILSSRRRPFPRAASAAEGGKTKIFCKCIHLNDIKQERWKPLTFFLRPAATLTVGIDLPPRNKMRFQCQVSSGIDCGALGRVLKRRKSGKRWTTDGLAGEAAER